MPQFSIAVTMFLAGLAVIAAAGLWRYCLKVQRRALASAFVGEIAGILRIIETNKLEERLHGTGIKRRSGRVTMKGLSSPLPQPSIFAANANRLDLFDPSMARRIAQVYTLLAGVKEGLPKVASDSGQAAAILTQLQEALGLADDILRKLKPML